MRLVLPANSVGTAQLKNDAVTSSKVRDNSLLARDFKKEQLPAGPRGPRGESGPSEAYTAFREAPMAVPVAVSPVSIAQLELPRAGSYVIDAKAYFVSTGSGIPLLTCRLDTHEGDIDQVQLLAGNATPVMLSVAHRYATPGTVDLECAGRAPRNTRFLAGSSQEPGVSGCSPTSDGVFKRPVVILNLGS